MRGAEIAAIARLRDRAYTVSELAEAIDRSQSWTSELVADLEDQNLVEKGDKVALATTYETQLLLDLLDTYDLTSILTGKKEQILTALLDDPKTVSELELDGFATSTLYQALNDLQARGVVEQLESGEFRITDDTLRDFLDARTHSPTTAYATNGERIVTSGEGQPTAFSAFQRYGVDYYPAETYRYQGDRDVGLEDVLIHAVRVADSKKQMAMCGVFFLQHRGSLDTDELWRLAKEWDCIERWADLQAYLDQREVKDETLFLPWEEFTALAHDYDLYPRNKHPGESLLAGLDELGGQLDTETDVYLLGGGNLILRGLKDSTKDIDVVVEDRETLVALVEALQELGYEERRDLADVYDQLNPSIVLEKQGFPRWDVFVEIVADQLQLTEAMEQRVDQTRTFGTLTVELLSLTDIFLFKAITDREGDLEDVALIARQADLDWQELFEELQTQEERTDQLFSFAVLDTLDLLEDRYGIQVPIHDKLVSYCLENALLVTLREPKTIEDLREELEFPDHRIYNKLRTLEDEGAIDVDRTGKLNTYRRSA